MTDSTIIGVSSCLLGEHVRYDCGHKHDHYITDILGQQVAVDGYLGIVTVSGRRTV